MDFFQNGFGFPESSCYTDTQNQLLQYASFEFIPPNTMASTTTCATSNKAEDIAPYPREKCTFHLPNDGRTLSAGTFSFPSVAELRAHVSSLNAMMSSKPSKSSTTTVTNILRDARALHSAHRHRDETSSTAIIIQAASQFNLLEFPSPSSVPEMGISGYAHDRTQGPACAMAAAGGTAYRNYLVDVQSFQNPRDAGRGQTRRGQTMHRQLNGLADVESWIASNVPGYDGGKTPWRVRNGYVESSSRDLGPISDFLRGTPRPQQDTLKQQQIDHLTSLLRIGVQRECTVTDIPTFDETVTQTYNSAISVGYSRLPSTVWEPVAQMVLNATYEATLLVGALEGIRASLRGGTVTPIVYLTKVGGGVFRNKDDWIIGAIARALKKVEGMGLGVDLDVRIVHFGEVDMKYSCLQSAMVKIEHNTILS